MDTRRAAQQIRQVKHRGDAAIAQDGGPNYSFDSGDIATQVLDHERQATHNLWHEHDAAAASVLSDQQGWAWCFRLAALIWCQIEQGFQGGRGINVLAYLIHGRVPHLHQCAGTRIEDLLHTETGDGEHLFVCPYE